MSENKIIIKGARVHNLKNIDVKIPQNKLVVITGLSGSGKSSLAFDTLYAEGQRRYVESLSAYARQFLGRMAKPEVDYIKGISPAVAIEQKVNTRNPRSTVGTSTEIYDFLKLLFTRVGKTISPVSGQEVKKHQAKDVAEYLLAQPEGTQATILAPISQAEDRTLAQQLDIFSQQGFSRVEIGGKPMKIQDIDKALLKNRKVNDVSLVVDRITVQHEDKDFVSRATDSAETAFYEGGGTCCVSIFFSVGGFKDVFFTERFEADGIVFEEPTEHTFSFNSPLGACPKCEGFGNVIGIDPDLVIPNKSLSVYDDAIACWRGEAMSEWKKILVYCADKFKFPIHKPYYQLTDEQKRLLWTGNKYFRGLNDFFQNLQENQYKVQCRVMLARYRGKTVCPDCGGSRLKQQVQYIKVGGKSITELVMLPVSELKTFFDHLQFSDHDAAVAKRLLLEINHRIQFLLDVGLGYLTLNRLSNSLSGGESQRINLTTSLGSSLVGSMYILDEPSIGLHSRDTHLLIKVLKQLRDLGNTVIVVEHDEEIIRAADYIIDIGPDAGRLGGEVVFAGVPPTAPSATNNTSYTLKYLSGEEKIEIPAVRRKWNNYIEIVGATENNLKNIDVKFPLNVLTAVTGVSGSGKSSLVRTVLYPALKKHYGGTAERTGSFAMLRGNMNLVTDIDFIDQNPIGKSSRSNPVTYVKAYDDIRKLFSEQPLAKQMGYTAGYFSFNIEGGRCEECQGDGTITVEMQFMADLVLECESCHGKRFKADTLEVLYKGKNIYEVLEMTVNEAVEFFSREKRIVQKLQTLESVGLGYIRMGQPLSTLSGGESQRVKLASFLGNEKVSPTIFIFDEPTTGLHFHDIKTLLKALDALISRGHTVIVIEHNLEVIKYADHVIDLGLEGGDQGGYVVVEGTPEDIAKCEQSYTGRFLKEKLF
ncbi:UvrABC system protein A [Bacteroidia bacterium]|nr:UvrABC system protein A [Bacteroidia bacterium]